MLQKALIKAQRKALEALSVLNQTWRRVARLAFLAEVGDASFFVAAGGLGGL